MPHYKDGTVAQIGDHVVGKPYNTDHEVAGTIVSISPGSDTCNLQVEFIESMPMEQCPTCAHASGATSPRMALSEVAGREAQTADHGTTGARHKRYVCRDYGEVKAFSLVARPAHVR